MHAVLEIIQKTTEFLGTKGVESPRHQAEHLIGHALGLKRMQLYLQFERLLTESELEKIRGYVRRRAQREPLQYIIGHVDWCDLTLAVDKRVLIPRPETEYLVELIESRLPAETPAPRILDLGTGSGALALALAQSRPTAQVTAVDRSPDALAVARANAEKNGLADRVTFIESDWWRAVPTTAPFDLIVSNPPYLTKAEVDEAEPEVNRHEPRSALEAAAEGLADLTTIVRGASTRLAPGGLLALETGIAQHPTLLTLLTASGLENAESVKDLTGRDRFLFARRPR